jgi:hypothetical protein
MKIFKNSRRDFIKKSTLATGAVLSMPLISGAKGFATNPGSKKIKRIGDFDKPLAIAMWDYSWLLRHHKYGSFEDWDVVLDGLVERGYNAIRIDCFPQFIASDRNGEIQEEFFNIREAWKPAYWGNQFSVYTRPREGLVEFMKKCEEKGVYVGLATWFMGHGTERNLEFTGIDGFVRAWDETLQYLNKHDLLDNVIYVDLLNEYPLWHGFEWFKKEMNMRGNEKLFLENNPDANVPDEVFEKRKGKGYTELQQQFYQNFIDTVIAKLQEKWPDHTFFASQTGGGSLWKQLDHKSFGALDPHFWFSQNGEFTSNTPVGGLNMFRSEKDAGFKEGYEKTMKYWTANKNKLADWMEGRIKYVAELGKKYKVPVGNTEGWGAVFWQDHPLLGWEFIMESADVAVDLSIKHGYKFICTSNFTHPQFQGMWRDVKWNRQITDRIKKG